jgi:flagellar biosynthesis component FlhA
VTIKELLSNEKIKNLPSNAFKAYLVLLNDAKNGKIENFTIRGLTREWTETKNLNLVTSKNSVKDIIRILESLNLIENNQKTKTLQFK